MQQQQQQDHQVVSAASDRPDSANDHNMMNDFTTVNSFGPPISAAMSEVSYIGGGGDTGSNQGKQDEELVETKSPVEDLLTAAKEIVELVDKKIEPWQRMRDMNVTLDQRAQEIILDLRGNQQLKQEFYKTVLKGCADKFLAEKMVSNPNYLTQILRFFRNILVNYFPNDIEDESLAEIVHSLFNLDAHLYTMALQSGCAKTISTNSTTEFQLLISQAVVNLSGINQNNNDEGRQNNSIIPNRTIEQDENLSLDQKRIISELDWRRSLKVGDRLDAQLGMTFQTTKVFHWAPCTIYKIIQPNSQFSDQSYYAADNAGQDPLQAAEAKLDFKFWVRFDGVPGRDGEQNYNSLSADIAPLRTFSNDFDWRYDLRKGDLVDCLDSEGIWYRSTVLDTRESNPDGTDTPIEDNSQPLKEVFIAYRYYDEEEGHKTDEEGKKYIGWSSKYDIWIPVASPQIQKIDSVSRHYRVAGRQTMVYDSYGPSDEGDPIQNSHSLKLWVLSRYNHFQNLKCITDYLNEFGASNGFDSILQLLKGNLSSKMTLRHVYFLIEFLQKTLPLWTRQFAVYYIPRLRQAFQIVMQSGILTVQFNRDHLHKVNKAFTSILKRFYTSSPSSSNPKNSEDNYHLISADIMFKVACSLLKSEKLAQRVSGLNEINEQLKNSRFGINRRGLSEKEMLTRLRGNNVLEIVFGASDLHVQMVQRGLEIAKFLVDQRDFQDNDLEVVWAAAERGDEQTKLEVYKIFKEMNTKLRNEDIEKIIDMFANRIPAEKFVIQELECVQELSRYCRMTPASIKALELFWDISVQTRPYQKDIIEPAMDKLINLLQNQERDLKIQYLNNCYECLNEHRSSIQAIRIMVKILDQIPNYRISNLPTSYEVASDLISQYQVITLVTFDLSQYAEQANSAWQKGIINAENIDSVEMLGLPFTHRFNVITRLNFIRQLLQLSLTHIQKDQLDQLWDILVTNSNVKADQQLFFEWFQGILTDGAKAIPFNLINDFFDSKVCAQSSFKDIRKSGFESIQTMFLQVNEQDEKIHVIYIPSSNLSNKDDKLNFIVHSPPNQLRGIEVIWKIFQECDKKNVELIERVIDLLTKLYHNLSDQITRDEIILIQDDFCNQCIHQMKIAADNKLMSDEDKKLFIKTLLAMLKSFLYDSERTGVGKLRYHAALDRGYFIEKLVLQNQITQLKSTPRYIEINAYSNMTVWELKKIAATHFRVSPLKIDLRRSDLKKIALNDLNNSKLLRDVKLESYELLLVNKKPAVSSQRVKLLNKKGELIPEARAIFTSWFEDHSTDGLMSAKQCGEFLKAAIYCVETIIKPDDKRIVELMSGYGLSNFGYLTLDEFLKFYRDKSETKPEAVWGNLTYKKYGGDLKPLSDANNPDDPSENKDISKLPRSKLTLQQETFNELIELLKTLPISSQEEMWPLISQLRTNPIIYSRILSLQNLDSLSYKNSSVFEILYQLQIIDSFINNYQDIRPQEMKLYYSESQESAQEFPAINEAYAQNNNESSNIRDVQAVAPESGRAIPLPPPEYANIPEPPKTQVPFIGPQPPPANGAAGSSASSQEQAQEQIKKITDMLEQFKGNTKSEPINDQIFEDRELAQILNASEEQIVELKTHWVQNFVAQGGFTVLMKLFEELINHSQSLKTSELLKSKIDKECWNNLLKILKVLLMSAFIPNLPSPELSLALSRRMSSSQEQQPSAFKSNNEEEAEEKKQENDQNQQSSDKKKSQILQDQEATAKIFAPLINIMSGDVGSKILESIDFKQFQDSIFLIVKLILRKKETIIMVDERTIVEQAIGIWISCIVFNQDLLQLVYDDWNAASSSSLGQVSTEVNKGQICKILLEEGLLSSNMLVRNLFKESIKFIAESITSVTLSEQPVIFFLRVVLQLAHITLTRHKESKQFFQLLRTLLQLYISQKQKTAADQLVQNEVFEHKALLNDYVMKLANYSSNEVKGKGLQEDHNLIGYLQVIQELIQSDQTCMSRQEQEALAEEIIRKCLFTLEIEPYNGDIVKQTDIAAHEKPYINKCNSLSSRRAAFSLLQTICSINPSLIQQIISLYINPMIHSVKKPKKAGYQPRMECRANNFCGLKNLGCTCYMNSMLQQFFCIPTLRYSLLSVKDKVGPNFKPFESDQVDDNLLHQLQKLMSFLELSERQDYNTREFCFAFKDFSGNPINVRQQQDTQEFLNVVFDRLEGQLAKTSQKYLLQNIFGGQNCAVMICKGCGNVRQTYDHFFNLSLEVKNQRSVYDGLRRLTTGEIISDFKCEACNQKVEVERKTVLHKLPNMLILHLQRIVFDMDTFTNQKLNSRIEFPNVLNLKPYMMDQILKEDRKLLKKAKRAQQQQESQKQGGGLMMQEDSDQHMSSHGLQGGAGADQQVEMSDDEDSQDETLKVEEEPNENFEYKLVGVVLHMGTADAGHYLSYININRGEKDEESPEWLLTDKEKWLEFNDSQVREYRFANMESDCFGGANPNQVAGEAIVDYSKNAYMLVYEKRRKQQVKLVIPPGQLSASTGDQNKIETSQGYDSGALSQIVKEMCPEITQTEFQLFTDEETKEKYTLIDFNAVQKFVPNELYKMVHKDNHDFLFERQVFNAGFFEALKEMIETLMTKEPQLISDDTEENDQLFNFMERLIFDILSMTSENKQLIELTKLYTQMLYKNSTQAFKLIEKRILLKDREAKEQREFFESLIQHMDKDVRDMNSMILLACVNVCFQKDNRELIDLIMNQVFSLMPEELSKNWLKVHQYLWFLTEVTKSGRKQLLYMMEHKLITKLIDFFLENESPMVTIGKGKKRQLMGSNYANPPLDQLILCISYIARQQPYINLEDNIQNKMDQNQHPKISRLCMNFQDPVPPLEQEDVFMLKQKAFISKAIKSGYEVVEVARLLAHLSCFNEQFSRQVAKKALVGLNKASADETFAFVQVIGQILCIYDHLMLSRLEWIMGISQLKLDKNYIYNSQTSGQTYKLGVQNLANPMDDVVEYKSTLFKTSSSVKDSFLQILFQYRKRLPRQVLDGLICLFQACLNDMSGYLFFYVYMMDPPTYAHARYLDWVKPYLQDSIQSGLRNQNIQAYRQELNLALHGNTLYDQLIQRFPLSGELQQQAEALMQQQMDPNAPRRVFQYDNLKDYGQQQHVIWKVVNERILDQQTDFDQMMMLTVRELEVRVSDSQPDGFTNRVFPASLFPHYNYNNGFNNHRNVNFNSDSGSTVNNQTQNWGKNRKYGRGAGAYQVRSNQGGMTIHQRKSAGGDASIRNKKKKKTIVVSGESDRLDIMKQNKNKQDKQPNQDIEESYLTDGGEGSEEHQDENSMDVEYNNDRTEDDQFGRDQTVPMDGPGGVSPANNQESNDLNDLTADPQGDQDASHQEGFEFEQNQLDQLNNPQESSAPTSQQQPKRRDQGNGIVPNVNTWSNNQQQNDPQESIDQAMAPIGDGQVEEDDSNWEANLWSVIVFTLTNLDKVKAQKVTLRLYPSTEMGPNGYQPYKNEYLPSTALPYQILSGRDRDCLVLQKLRPFEDWSKFTWRMQVGEVQASVPDVPAGFVQQPDNDNNGHTDDIEMIVDEKPNNVITCSACTFDNDPNLSFCEVCGGALSK